MTMTRFLLIGALVAPALLGVTKTAVAAGPAFDVAAVIEQVKRELAAVQEPGGEGQPLRIDEAQLQLELVEGPGGGRNGARMMVPGGDFLANKEGGKPALRQRLTIDVAPSREARGGGGAGGGLTLALGEARSAVRSAMATMPSFDLKRMTVDLDFLVERDSRGQIALIAYAQDRHPQSSNVQGLKVKFATKEK